MQVGRDFAEFLQGEPPRGLSAGIALGTYRKGNLRCCLIVRRLKEDRRVILSRQEVKPFRFPTKFPLKIMTFRTRSGLFLTVSIPFCVNLKSIRYVA